MKTEQTAFAERLLAALREAGIEASPADLVKLIARNGGNSVTAQAVSGWLSGKSLPKQVNLRALAKITGVDPAVLQFGGHTNPGVREPQRTWPEHVRGYDRLAFEEYLLLPEAHKKLVRELIAALATVTTRGRAG